MCELNGHTYTETIKKIINQLSGYTIVINFEENYKLSLNKTKLFQSINDRAELYLVFYEVASDFMECCNQMLTWINDVNEDWGYYICEACCNKYILPELLIDVFVENTAQANLYKKMRYLKGEF